MRVLTRRRAAVLTATCAALSLPLTALAAPSDPSSPQSGAAAESPASGAVESESAESGATADVDASQSGAETTMSGGTSADPAKPVITLAAITDFHGHLARADRSKEGGAVALACAVQDVRAANPDALFVSAGDNVGGSAFMSSILQDEPTIKALNAIELDVSAAGNHEFDKGVTDLAGRITDHLDAPVLAANVTGNATLAAEGDGRGVFVKDVQGVRVGFVGVVTDELPSLVSPTALAGLTITDPTATANERAKELKDGDPSNGEADVVVVLAHEDAEVNASQFTGAVDAVVGGHTHVPYAQVVKSTEGTDIAVVQPDHYGILLGRIDLTVEPKAEGGYTVAQRTASNTNLWLEKPTCEDAYGVKAIVDKAVADSTVAGEKEVATLGGDFLRATKADENGTIGAPGDNRGAESTASNLIADSFAWWVQNKTTAEGTHFVGVMNPGGVRADYEAGPLTFAEAYAVQPFGNELSYGTYTVGDLKAILAEQWKAPDAEHPVLTLGLSSNVQVVYDADIAAMLQDEKHYMEADRSKLITSVTIDYYSLPDDAEIVIATNAFLAAGGDSFSSFKRKPTLNTGTLDLEATSEYFANHTPEELTPSGETRQVGMSVKNDPATGWVRVEYTDLLYTNPSEQKLPDALTALRPMWNNETYVLQKLDVDMPVDPTVVVGKYPTTGTASFERILPAEAYRYECGDDPAVGCAWLEFRGMTAQGPTSAVGEVLDVKGPRYVPATVPAPTAGTAGAAAGGAASGKGGTLASTGVDGERTSTILLLALLTGVAGAAFTASRRRAGAVD